MEFFVLLLLGAIGVLILGSIFGFIANSRVQKLELEVKSLRVLVMSQADSPARVWPPKSAAPINPGAQKITPTTASIPLPQSKAAAVSTLTQTTERVLKASSPSNAKPAKPKQSIEEMIGAKWSVWVGGLALFLGAIFLLRYTIEAGFFTPTMRIIMAAFFGLLLLGAGEFLHRADPKIGGMSELAKSVRQKAYIPSMLTAIGIFSLLGTVYAAFALYGFLNAPMAFVLMAVISLLALALGLLHGPSLAALGLAASLLTPLLIQQDMPSAYTLYAYLSIISAAALVLAKKRVWGWLSISALFGSLVWLFLSLDATEHSGPFAAWLVFAGLLFAASTYTALSSKTPKPKTGLLSLKYGTLAATIWASVAALAVFAAADANDFAAPQFYAGYGYCAILFAAGLKWPQKSWHILIGGTLGAALIFSAAYLGNSVSGAPISASILSAAFIALSYSRLSVPFSYLGENEKGIIWPLASTLLPIALFVGLYKLNVSSDMIFGAIFLGLCAVFAALTYRVSKTCANIAAMSVYALGAGLAFLCAVMIGLDNIWLTLGLFVGIILAGLASVKLPLTVNRMMTAGFAVLAAAQILTFEITDPASVSGVTIFNQLWIYFALPTLICAVEAWAISKNKTDLWSEGLKALSLAFLALFLIFQIRHVMNGGNLFADRYSLDELALQVLVGLSFTLGGSLIAAPKVISNKALHTQLIPGLMMGVSFFTLAAFVLGICLVRAPLFNTGIDIRGGWILNSVLLAYLLPALMLGLVSYLSRGKRPLVYVQVMAALSLVSFMFYITSMVRVLFFPSDKAISAFHDSPMISIFLNPPEGLELYMISAVWLLIGIALLVWGLKGQRQELRLASAVIIVLTLLKAFLVDMSSLEGVLRALSFVGLGLVLIVIGRAYQRLLFKDKTATNDSSA